MEEFSSGVMVQSEGGFCSRFLWHIPWHHSLVAEDSHIHTSIVIFARHASCTFSLYLAGTLLYTSGWFGLGGIAQKKIRFLGCGLGRKRSNEMK
jgi:hypothetical protein